MKPAKKGIARIIDAAGYSMQGLKAAFRHEAAFRQELFLFLVLFVSLFAQCIAIGRMICSILSNSFSIIPR